MKKAQATTVFFDGMCPICSREVRLYERLQRAATRPTIEWLDLREPSGAGASMLRDNGIDLDAAMRLLHVQDARGRFHVGIQAHIRMWAELPYFRHIAAALSRVPVLQRMAEILYLFFTKYRPGLRRPLPTSNDDEARRA